MRKAFSLIELMIVVAIIAIIAAIAIPAIIQNKKETINGVSVGYRDVVGKTFFWNGNKIFVTDYKTNGGIGAYKIAILNKNNSIAIEADAKSVFEAYKNFLLNPKNLDVE